MSTGNRTILQRVLVLTAAAALVVSPSAFASAADVVSEGTAPFSTPGTRYELVDAHGDVVGELVSESATRVRLRTIGVTNVRRAPSLPAPDARADGRFHPDYSRALSTGQMSAAWQTELDRLFPQPVAGGG
jgi:hypothetical protein